MARRTSQPHGDWLFPAASAGNGAEESSLLDVLDNVLNRGAVVNGDVVLGVANVDLIYLKLSVLLAALDKLTKQDPTLKSVAAGPTSRKHRQRRRRAGVKKSARR